MSAKWRKIFKSILRPSKLAAATKYAIYCNNAYDATVDREYRNALEYYGMAEDVSRSAGGSGLLDQDMLARAYVHGRLKMYPESLRDVRLAMKKMEGKKYTTSNLDYLRYYAGRLEARSQAATDEIVEADSEFTRLEYSKLEIAKVSKSIKRNFPLTKNT